MSNSPMKIESKVKESNPNKEIQKEEKIPNPDNKAKDNLDETPSVMFYSVDESIEQETPGENTIKAEANEKSNKLGYSLKKETKAHDAYKEINNTSKIYIKIKETPGYDNLSDPEDQYSEVLSKFETSVIANGPTSTLGNDNQINQINQINYNIAVNLDKNIQINTNKPNITVKEDNKISLTSKDLTDLSKDFSAGIKKILNKYMSNKNLTIIENIAEEIDSGRGINNNEHKIYFESFQNMLTDRSREEITTIINKKNKNFIDLSASDKKDFNYKSSVLINSEAKSSRDMSSYVDLHENRQDKDKGVSGKFYATIDAQPPNFVPDEVSHLSSVFESEKETSILEEKAIINHQQHPKRKFLIKIQGI